MNELKTKSNVNYFVLPHYFGEKIESECLCFFQNIFQKSNGNISSCLRYSYLTQDNNINLLSTCKWIGSECLINIAKIELFETFHKMTLLHDLKNSLTALMLGNTLVLKEKDNLSDQAKKLLELNEGSLSQLHKGLLAIDPASKQSLTCFNFELDKRLVESGLCNQEMPFPKHVIFNNKVLHLTPFPVQAHQVAEPSVAVCDVSQFVSFIEKQVNQSYSSPIALLCLKVPVNELVLKLAAQQFYFFEQGQQVLHPA